MAQLPDAAPDGMFFDVRGTEFLPIAVFTFVDLPEAQLEKLVVQLEGDQGPDEDNDDLPHLLQLASQDTRKQNSLSATLKHHIDYCKQKKGSPEYYPYAFVAIHSKDYDNEGVYVVYMDFDKPHAITAFRTSVDNAADACQTIRDDEDGIEQVVEYYALK
ncbi:hypothetical protein AMS68_001899 [Peltaster fructicola]|uniref:Uncharacterized protein n=1 Tax=Peltaster fructicola TaxID=286661 RepID=A0A6H0XNP8_9PEZI|nr:hypothetical protein AMS68_001899 [Peltaster fructicola]